MTRIRRKSGGARNEGPQRDGGEPAPAVRFEATIHSREADAKWVERLAVDRIPDAQGLVRALLTAADCVRLLNQGLEIRLHRAYAVQPLDPALVEDEQTYRRRLEKELRSMQRSAKS